MTCQMCSTPIESSGPGRPRKFCSDECRREWWQQNQDKLKTYHKRCVRCGAKFTTSKRGQKYCSTSCGQMAPHAERENAPLVTVWSCGAGVDSTAIAVLIINGTLPKPDIAVMMDSGYEIQATYDHVYGRLVPALAAVGVDLEVIQAKDWTDEIGAVDPSCGVVRIPAFLDRGGRPRKMRTMCNSPWKVRPFLRMLADRGVLRFENWVGIAADEAHRVRESPRKSMTLRYPLIELELSRRDCLEVIRKHGWPRPPRTSCLFCPQQSDAEWRELHDEYPNEWHRAIVFERELREQVDDVYLHRSLVTLDKLPWHLGWQ